MVSEHLKGLLITGAGVLILTPDTLLVRLIAVDQWALLFWRGTLMAAGLMVGVALSHGCAAPAILRSIGRAGLLVAVLFTGSSLFFITSLTHTYVANTLVMISAAPLFAAIFSHGFLGEVVARRTWVAILVAIGSIGLMVSGSARGGMLFGDLAAAGAAGCMAGAFVVIRRARRVSMLPAMALSGIFTAIAALPLAEPFAVDGADAGLLVLLGLFILPLAFSLITLGPRYLPAPEVSLIMLLETVLGPFWVWLVLGESPPRYTLAGGIILLLTLAAHSALALRADASERK